MAFDAPDIDSTTPCKGRRLAFLLNAQSIPTPNYPRQTRSFENYNSVRFREARRRASRRKDR
jgi:hypothetical protein